MATRLLRLKRKQRIELAKYRARHAKDFKTAKELESSFSLKAGKKLEATILKVEIKAQVLDAVVGGYDDIVKAASREMSRRDSERAPRD